ncbi:MAG: YceI family protein [Myxococcota bacterium]|nr:YceI family protein [Myxococcota bacterium]
MKWHIDPNQSTVSLSTESTFHKSTSIGGIRGHLFGAPDSLGVSAGGLVVVPVENQRFGNRMQDYAMYKHLDSQQWPEAHYEVTGLDVLSRNPWRIRVHGVIHYRDMDTPLSTEATGTVTADRLEAKCSFSLRLAELGVAPPRLLFMRVSENVDVDVHIIASAVS